MIGKILKEIYQEPDKDNGQKRVKRAVPVQPGQGQPVVAEPVDEEDQGD